MNKLIILSSVFRYQLISLIFVRCSTDVSSSWIKRSSISILDQNTFVFSLNGQRNRPYRWPKLFLQRINAVHDCSAPDAVRVWLVYLVNPKWIPHSIKSIQIDPVRKLIAFFYRCKQNSTYSEIKRFFRRWIVLRFIWSELFQIKVQWNDETEDFKTKQQKKTTKYIRLKVILDMRCILYGVLRSKSID